MLRRTLPGTLNDTPSHSLLQALTIADIGLSKQRVAKPAFAPCKGEWR